MDERRRTNAVELVRGKQTGQFHVVIDRLGLLWMVGCVVPHEDAEAHSVAIRASPSDIRLGFLPNLCPRCVPDPKRFGKEARDADEAR